MGQERGASRLEQLLPRRVPADWSFPQGTLVFPRNKYVVLRLGSKEVVAEDVLESMVRGCWGQPRCPSTWCASMLRSLTILSRPSLQIVFSEAWWVGRMEDNPSESRLPMPPELASSQLHDKYDFAGPGRGADASGMQAGTQGAAEDVAEDEEEAEAEEPASQRPARRATRQAGGCKRQRYNEDSDASLPGEDEEDGEDGVGWGLGGWGLPAMLPGLAGFGELPSWAARRRCPSSSCYPPGYGEGPAPQKLPHWGSQQQRTASQLASRQLMRPPEDEEM